MVTGRAQGGGRIGGWTRRALTRVSSRSKCNDLVLDVEGGNASQGAQVWMFERNDTNAQKWR